MQLFLAFFHSVIFYLCFKDIGKEEQILDQFLTQLLDQLKQKNLGSAFDSTAQKKNLDMYMYVYIYICAVKLKTGPIFALLKVKTGPFLLFFAFFVFANLVLPAERRIFFKRNKKENKEKHFLKLKTGPITLLNILGPIFNFNLHQFLTLEILL